MDDIIITQAVYLTTAVNKTQYPEEKKPEIAFIGRSNAGKSSLINSLTRMKNLARVSSQPGKTRTINFFDVGIKEKDAERESFYLVDLPGYGYAKIGRQARKGWEKFIEEYFLSSKELLFVCQLMDIRHLPSKEDVEHFKFFLEHDIPVLVIATKADKIGKVTRQKNIAAMKNALGVPELSILPYSSLKNEGRSDLLDVIHASLIK